MASLRKRGRTWYYRFVDSDGVRHERKGCPDRRETEAMAAAAELEASKIKAGLIDPKALGFRDHEARKLADHLTDFHAYLIGKGATPNHANLTRNRVARLHNLARARRVSDLSPSRIQSALKTIRDEGLSLRSVHHHVRAVKGFSRWLWRDGRAREVALAHLTSQNPDADRRHERRALTPDELARVFQAAERGPVVLKTTGPDRAALYRVAAGTGFRANELRSLTPESFDLAAVDPTVTVKAAYSKRRRDDVQPIRPGRPTPLGGVKAFQAARVREPVQTHRHDDPARPGRRRHPLR
jgi:integrase